MSAWSEYHEAILQVHRENGAPSSRTVAKAAGGDMSHTTVNDALRGKRLSSWPTTERILTGMGASVGVIARLSILWTAAYKELSGRETPSTGPNVSASPPPLRTADALILDELRAIRDLLEDLVELHRREGN